MQFVDLKTQFERIENDVCSRVDAVLRSQKYIMGPEIKELESKLAAFAGVKHVLTCSSGTEALVIPLMAYALERTDAVFVPSFTFFASAESVTLAGGTPVLVDSDPVTFDISPASLQEALDRVIAQGELKPRGIIPVDLFGHPAAYDEIRAIAQRYDLFILEDAAQGFGASYKGKRTGSLGDIAATSFFPAKPLGCYGDGGAIFTDDDNLFELADSIRVHGHGVDKYDNVRIGVNGRMDTIQAAVVLAKLEVFEDEIVRRNEVAACYTAHLEGSVVVPRVASDAMSVWAQYTVMLEDAVQRERVIARLQEAGIPSAIYYPIPVHLSTAYAGLGYKVGDLPVCENMAQRVMSLPMHPYLAEKDIKLITDTLKEAL